MTEASFIAPQLFDESWHKVTIGVAQDQATLYVDCQPVQGLFGEYYTPLEPRGPVDATGGYLSVARQVARPITVPVSPIEEDKYVVGLCFDTFPSLTA